MQEQGGTKSCAGCKLGSVQSVKENKHGSREQRVALTPKEKSESYLLARGNARSLPGSLNGNANSRKVQVSKIDVFGVEFSLVLWTGHVAITW